MSEEKGKKLPRISTGNLISFGKEDGGDETLAPETNTQTANIFQLSDHRVSATRSSDDIKREFRKIQLRKAVNRVKLF